MGSESIAHEAERVADPGGSAGFLAAKKDSSLALSTKSCFLSIFFTATSWILPLAPLPRPFL